MIQFYYSPLSPNARRVWVMLLEKQLRFESHVLTLKGDQRDESFVALNPFQQIPVLIDDGFRVVESLVILDYLEAVYPQPRFWPQDPQACTIARMVAQLTDNKLLSQLGTLIAEKPESLPYQRSLEILHRTLNFWEDLLGDLPYFGGKHLSVGDIVAGTTLPLFLRLGLDLAPYPKLNHWIHQLQQRSSWQETDLDEAAWREFKRRIHILMMQAKRRSLMD